MNKFLFIVAIFAVAIAIGSSFYFDSASVVLLDAANESSDSKVISYQQAKADLSKTLASPTLNKQLKQELSEFLVETDKAIAEVEKLEANLNQAESEQAIADLEASLRAEYEKAGLDYDLEYEKAQKTITAEPTDQEIQRLLKSSKPNESAQIREGIKNND